MKRIMRNRVKQPYFVLSAGCGLGKEAMSVVITWHRLLKEYAVAEKDFPLIVIALDAARENLDAIKNWQSLWLTTTDLEQACYDLADFFVLDETMRIRPLPHTMAPIHTTQINLLEPGQVLELKDFTPNGRGFNAIFCHSVTMYYKSDEAMILATLQELLLPRAKPPSLLFHYNAGEQPIFANLPGCPPKLRL